MAVGRQVTKADIDTLAPAFLRELNSLLNGGQWQEFAQWLSSTPDATLLAAPYSYTQAEINVLKAAYAEAVNVRTAWNGATGARFYARQLWGLGTG